MAAAQRLLFLSTPSARRATAWRWLMVTFTVNFYPRPPRGGRHQKLIAAQEANDISIHALREEGDASCRCSRLANERFLSTPSARRATGGPCPTIRGPDDFYPRPPRGGRLVVQPFGQTLEDFYPRPPRGGRPVAAGKAHPYHLFLSTPSARRATADRRTTGKQPQISIHALREEGDSKNRDKISIFKQIIQHSARI